MIFWYVQAGYTSKSALDVSLPLWRRTAQCLHSVMSKTAPSIIGKSTFSSVLGTIWGADSDEQVSQESLEKDIEKDGCISMGLSADDCAAVDQILSPRWARNATTLRAIRREIPDSFRILYSTLRFYCFDT